MTNFSQRITASIKRDARNLESLVKAQQNGKDVIRQDVQDLGESIIALKALIDVQESIFGSLEAFGGNYEEWLESMIDQVESMKDIATLATNSHVFLLDPNNLALVLNEITLDRWELAIRQVETDKLDRMLKKARRFREVQSGDDLLNG